MTIKTKPATDEYRDNWDRIFGGKQVEPLCDNADIDAAPPRTLADRDGAAQQDTQRLNSPACAAFCAGPVE